MTRFALAIAFCLAALPAAAAPFERVRPVYDLLGMPELMGIMREEGVGYGTDLEGELFAGRGGAEWQGVITGIYDEDRMARNVLSGLDSELDDDAIAGISAFFDSELGRRIISLEVSARRAMLDDAVEEAAGEGWLRMQKSGGERWTLIQDFAEANELIESNVAGAMTSNYAFYRGLVDGNAFDFVLTEEEILTDVWGQEPQIRADTTNWVYSFTTLAYQPLSDDELQAYLDFARTPAGKAMNAALFTVFNEMFSGISHDLGLGAARFVAGQDI